MKENPIHPDPAAQHGVRIQIDRSPYESPTPTTGAALYVLGGIPADKQIYKEIHGDEEDEPVFNNADKIDLKQGDHFYSTCERFKGYTIIVNGRPKVVQKNVLIFAEIVALAFDTPPTGPNIVISVAFRNAAGDRREGTLAEGGSVTIKNGTIFNVTATDKS